MQQIQHAADVLVKVHDSPDDLADHDAAEEVHDVKDIAMRHLDADRAPTVVAEHLQIGERVESLHQFASLERDGVEKQTAVVANRDVMDGLSALLILRSDVYATATQIGTTTGVS
jgi:hypothetical protein